MKRIILTMLVSAFSLVASAKGHCDTLVVKTNPEMRCSGCENRIKNDIRFVKGTKKIETSLEKQTVTIVYDYRYASYDIYAKAFEKLRYEIVKVKK